MSCKNKFGFAATISHRPRRECGNRKHPDQCDCWPYHRQRSFQETTDFRAAFACKHLTSPLAERSGWIIKVYPNEPSRRRPAPAWAIESGRSAICYMTRTHCPSQWAWSAGRSRLPGAIFLPLARGPGTADDAATVEVSWSTRCDMPGQVFHPRVSAPVPSRARGSR